MRISVQNKSKILYSPIDLFSSKIISFVGSYCYSVDAHFDQNYETKLNIFSFSFMDPESQSNVCIYDQLLASFA